ncbi:MAG: Dihydroneopterin aldolase [Candidatus Dichloromethanomonas elyunquensis]|nr:MAG: Dihydroneopterin aldolase [Candidatus Dichloromethanomonas elyunquensis]
MREDSIIRLRGMEFYAYHGVLDQEKELGQRFLVDLDIYSGQWAYETDSLKDTVDYSKVFKVIEQCVTQERYDLLESLAERIASQVLVDPHCSKVRVVVHKPNAPIPGIFKDVSVEVIREKRT